MVRRYDGNKISGSKLAIGFDCRPPLIIYMAFPGPKTFRVGNFLGKTSKVPESYFEIGFLLL